MTDEPASWAEWDLQETRVETVAEALMDSGWNDDEAAFRVARLAVDALDSAGLVSKSGPTPETTKSPEEIAILREHDRHEHDAQPRSDCRACRVLAVRKRRHRD